MKIIYLLRGENKAENSVLIDRLPLAKNDLAALIQILSGENQYSELVLYPYRLTAIPKVKMNLVFLSFREIPAKGDTLNAYLFHLLHLLNKDLYSKKLVAKFLTEEIEIADLGDDGKIFVLNLVVMDGGLSLENSEFGLKTSLPTFDESVIIGNN